MLPVKVKQRNSNSSIYQCEWTLDTEGQTFKSRSSNLGYQQKTISLDIWYIINGWRDSS